METQQNPFWSEEVKTHYTPIPGTFTRNAEEVVDSLLKGANGDATVALHRLVFYMNRAGSKLTNKQQLNKAKYLLETIIKLNKESVH